MTLAAPTDGLVLADGRIVMPNGVIVDPNAPPEQDDDDALIEVPSNTEAQQLVVATRRKLADLPAVPRTMNAISAVLSYTLFGLDDDEIALATGMTLEQIEKIREQEAYGKMKSSVVESILQSDSDNVRELIAQQSRKSVNKIVAALDGKKVSGLQMAAAKDLLDRAGHRPVDVIEHRHKMAGNLVIEVIRRNPADVVPTIDME